MFDLDTETGRLLVRKKLDFEAVSRYQLSISTPREGRTQISVNVQDANDAPQFAPHRKVVTIARGRATRWVMKFAATDQDNGTRLSYYLTGGRQYGAFAIDKETGELEASGDLQPGRYALHVTVRDDHSESLPGRFLPDSALA